MGRNTCHFGLGRAFDWGDCGRWWLALGFGLASAASIVPVQAQQLCGGVNYPFPYTDVSGVGAAFCPGIIEAYVTGVTKGTSPTTFSPNETVSRVQMTTFLQRSLDQGLVRTSRRAALNQWWTPTNINVMRQAFVNGHPLTCAADGQAIWVSIFGEIFEVQPNDGVQVGNWTGATNSVSVVVAAGFVYAVGETAPGELYLILPANPGDSVINAATLGNNPIGLAFDGTNLWSANSGSPGSVSIITPQASPPYPVTTVTTGFDKPFGVLFDGSNIWITDQNANTLLKLDAAGAILQTVPVGMGPQYPVFDGTNIWVPNFFSNSITVVQASTGKVVATIGADAENQLDNPLGTSFDGERILVTNYDGGSVTLFKAADLSFIANVPTGSASGPNGACSDGINFWISLSGTANMLRF